MKKLLIVMLIGSLLTNAWLLRRPLEKTTMEISSAVVAPSAPARPTALAIAVHEIETGLKGGDIAQVRERLVAAGADDTTVRVLVEGLLRRRYDEQAAAWRIERMRNAWWLGGASATRGTPAPSARELVGDPLFALVGRNPLDLADAELRYNFLPPEKRRLLAMIDLDYADLQARAPSGNMAGAMKSVADELDLLTRERNKDTLAALNAEERAEYELRFSDAAISHVRKFAVMAATEPEFRIIVPVLDAVTEEVKALLSSDPTNVGARAKMEQRAMDQLVAKLGYERALDYFWAAESGPYLPTTWLMQEMGLPGSRAAQLLQLAAETGVQGAAIHNDSSLTPEQKQSALVVLQNAVRPQLDALVPPAVQPKLSAPAFEWFTALGEGRYATFRPLVTSGWMGATPVSVTSPPRAPQQPVPLPRRSGN